VSATDSEHIPKRFRFSIELIRREDFLLWAAAIAGLIAAFVGLAGYAMDWPGLILPFRWWVILGAGGCVVSCIGLLDRYDVVNIRQDQHSQLLQIRERIEAYYNRGQEIYQRLGTDPTIAPEDVRQFVAEEWLHPVTEYLRGTLGNRKASYFINVVRVTEPDEPSIQQFGHQRAVARARIMDRLSRLRDILNDLHSFT
jgi:hypothetical protein